MLNLRFFNYSIKNTYVNINRHISRKKKSRIYLSAVDFFLNEVRLLRIFNNNRLRSFVFLDFIQRTKTISFSQISHWVWKFLKLVFLFIQTVGKQQKLKRNWLENEPENEQNLKIYRGIRFHVIINTCTIIKNLEKKRIMSWNNLSLLILFVKNPFLSLIIWFHRVSTGLIVRFILDKKDKRNIT